ncbi:MAG: DUF3291 domain-containing protein [Rhodobacteraceae bacterium]|nr:DUF3291 domain-containing protein [Alphaproteobacteria bacterium]MBT8474465.1 DUF3291 domain-containing protein [Alphaproteobacteria bacterium]NNF72122.1 DUF3291 domain-containing protein [Paracoccaceae bacterium]NNK65422.1 DUF3291 domain-containing protein [Paracoccaceae bacterium]
MSQPGGHIAHLNWAYLKAPWGDPAVAGFVNNVDQVNAVAARSPGFVARPDISDRALAKLLDLVVERPGPVDPDCLAVTLSVWESDRALSDFVYKTIHGKFLNRRAEWFVPQGVANYAIWPIAAGHTPTITEAKAKMRHLQDNGPSEVAYDFKWMRRGEQEAAE